MAPGGRGRVAVFRNGGTTPRERELENKEQWEALTRQSSKLALYEIKRSCGFSAAEIREMKLPEAVPEASVTLICEAFGLARVAYYATGKLNKTRSGGPAARETAGGNRPFVCSDDVVVILNFRLDLLNAFSFPIYRERSTTLM